MGPIPARAGQPQGRRGGRGWATAYPRSRGATAQLPVVAALAQGLSPLARGNPMVGQDGIKPDGPIPARAGQPEVVIARPSRDGAYPRSRGATASEAHQLVDYVGLSPLARGNLLLNAPAGVGSGPIPARAGQPRSRASGCPRTGAYPRSRGATSLN